MAPRLNGRKLPSSAVFAGSSDDGPTLEIKNALGMGRILAEFEALNGQKQRSPGGEISIEGQTIVVT
jgi:hypothetical protein